ncbi:MAG: recombinase family protein [Bryobacterales bacterium]|nr:recombinase family protein [Bryobacterales bacterium]
MRSSITLALRDREIRRIPGNRYNAPEPQPQHYPRNPLSPTQKQPSPYIRKVEYTVLSVAGLEGTKSEFELNLLRQRCQEAIRQEAQRGELQSALPVGYRWAPNGKVEKDPDRRIQQAIELVFAKLQRAEKVSLPALTYGESGRELIWKPPVYHTIRHMLRNPMYAGGYAFGKTESRINVVGGRARKTIGHNKPVETWAVLIRDHHPGYITWEQYEQNQALLADNAHMKSRMEPKAGRGGRSLLAGLLRCRRCGRILGDHPLHVRQ